MYKIPEAFSDQKQEFRLIMRFTLTPSTLCHYTHLPASFFITRTQYEVSWLYSICLIYFFLRAIVDFLSNRVYIDFF